MRSSFPYCTFVAVSNRQHIARLTKHVIREAIKRFAVGQQMQITDTRRPSLFLRASGPPYGQDASRLMPTEKIGASPLSPATK